MRTIKPILGIVLVFVLTAFLAVGCTSRLSDKFDENQVEKQAEKVATLSCTGKNQRGVRFIKRSVKGAGHRGADYCRDRGNYRAAGRV